MNQDKTSQQLAQLRFDLFSHENVTYFGYEVHSGTSNKGPSEIGMASLQRTLVAKSPLFRGSTVILCKYFMVISIFHRSRIQKLESELQEFHSGKFNYPHTHSYRILCIMYVVE